MLLWCAFLVAFASQEPARPLPDAESFRKDVPRIGNDAQTSFFQAVYRQDFIFNAVSYSYSEKETSITQDQRATVDTRTYTITRGPEMWQRYRKQISGNGSPLTDQEMQQQDRNHQRSEESFRANLARLEAESDSAKSKAAEASARARQATNDDTMALFDIRVIGRERIDNIPVVSLELKPRRQYKPKTEVGEILKDWTIRAWVTENDRQVVRLTADLDEEYNEGVAVVEKGATLSVERRLINEEVWLPTRLEITKRRPRVNGRLGPPQRVITEFSDFKKFTVDAVIRPVGIAQ